MAYDVNLPLYLRIEKVGTVYTFLYKPDTGDPEADAQVAWTALGTYTLDEPVQYVGLQVRTNDSTSGDVILDVDYFRLERYGPAACVDRSMPTSDSDWMSTTDSGRMSSTDSGGCRPPIPI